MTDNYLPRIADASLTRLLRSSGAVLIEGPKWCGKTTTAMRLSKSFILMADPDQHLNYQKIISAKPSLLLEGETPRLIDEWQLAPILWDAVRFIVDKRSAFAQFILTGSSVPLNNATLHTGTGRISRYKMRTMSLYESRESNGQVSLGELFNGVDEIKGFSNLTIERLSYALARGGWPQSLNLDGETSLDIVSNYVEAIVNKDVNEIDGIEKNPTIFRKLMRSIARCSASMANNETIRRDILGEDSTISAPTVSSYINILKRIHVIEDLIAWNPVVRSKTAIRTTDTRHYVDPSLAAAILRINHEGLLKDFNTFGLLFESLCVRDLRIYVESIDGEVFHYRDSNGLECDAIVQLKDGRWCAIEIKLGSGEIDYGAKNLLKLASLVNKKPEFLMILTGTNIAYRRDDGVFVVPIGCLKN
ncbi:MAG: DUF4143 domain-containing protein [Christensenellaceae bacterium]|jgi:predicted AAA+ superfamily ATPase|nr:DUF4143 domain-containing protein [Christensenellaceae bacterium]